MGYVTPCGSAPHISLARLSQTYGPVICLQMGSINTVVVSSASLAKDVLKKHDISLSYRTVPDVLGACGHRDFSIVMLPPHAEWRNLRKIVNSEVFSTSRLDARSYLRKDKVNDMLSQVDACCSAGVAVDIGQVAFNTALDLLSNTFFSVDLADLQLGSGGSSVGFKELIRQVMFEIGKPNVSDYFPLLKRLDLQGIRRGMQVHFAKVLDLFDSMIHQRLETAQGRRRSVDESDALDVLLKMTQENNRDSFNNEYLRHLLMDLFAAGTDTTSSTLEWAMAELLRNPSKLNKVQKELEDVIGKRTHTNEADMLNLPYLQAVIKETFRLHPPVPFLIPRKAVTDIMLGDFKVPKDSQVLINIWAMGKDPSVWEDANVFMPERFIGSNIDVKGFDFELIPFGAGRRICPGMSLAMRMLHMMLASLIHSFEWRLESNITPENMDMDERFGLTLQKEKSLRVIPIRKS